MANQDLLKQAIAEAKAIREAAISNAKDVMEESLTPHLKDMLAAKLQEMEAEEMEETVEEEVLEEEEAIAEETVEEEAVEEGSYEKDEMDETVEEAEETVAEEDEPAEDDAEESEDEAEEEAEESEEDAEEIEDMDVADLKDLIRDIIAQEMGHGEEEGIEDIEGEDEIGGVEDMVAADDEEINLEELLSELEALAEEDVNEEEVNEEEVTEASHDLQQEMEEEVTEDVEEQVEEEVTEEVEESNELQEALDTIEILRKELSEVNLLNSKLLYVNKIFKANNLSEAQKVNIITTFDKAETVKEVKLVYETVAENIAAPKSEKSNIKEHKSFASKATGNSTKGEVISEVSEQVRRMQKLAGIIK